MPLEDLLAFWISCNATTPKNKAATNNIPGRTTDVLPFADTEQQPNFISDVTAANTSR